MPVQYLDWKNCYDFHKLDSLIVPESTSHPARFPWGLINRIIDFCLEKGYIKPGEVCADPFAGVGIGGIACAYKGIRWLGCELEPRFVAWAKQNFAKHAAVWDKFGLPHPIIVNGDSRNFQALVAQALAAVVSSPPFEDTQIAHVGQSGDAGSPEVIAQRKREDYGKYGHADGNIGNASPGEVADAILTSPPFTDENNQPRIGQGTREQLAAEGKLPRALNQTSEGNIANLPADSADLSAIVTSPVYADQVVRKRESTGKEGMLQGTTRGRLCFDQYGESKGQIADCPEGEVSEVIDLAITSPVYGDSLERPGGGRLEDGFGVGRSTPGKSCGPHSNLAQSSYGVSEGQVSGMPEGSVDLVAASPPFSNISPEKSSDGIDLTKQYETYRSQGGGMSFLAFCAQQKKHSEGYGKTDGQIANQAEGEISCVVGSPPWSGVLPMGESHRNFTTDERRLHEEGVSQMKPYTAEKNAPGDIASMEFDSNIDVVLTSPAYPKDALGHAGGEGPRTTDAPHSRPGTSSSQSYGEGAENVGNLEEGKVVDAIISSPVYATITTGCGGLNTKPGSDGQQSGRSPDAYSQQSGGVYSEDEANIANALKDGEISAVLGSPPFGERKAYDDAERCRASVEHMKEQGSAIGGTRIHEPCGDSPGSIDQVEAADTIDACVGSPPFAETEQGNLEDGRKGVAGSTPKARMKADYVHGGTPGQISRLPEMSEEVKNTYWGACRLVYEQVHLALKPGGVCCLVLKDFIRGGERIKLCDNTARLLEAVGFEMLYRIRSWLVEKTDHGMGFLGPMTSVKRRSSFFRRIHEGGIRDSNWWKTLTSDVQAVYLMKAKEKAQNDHVAAVAKWEGTDKKKPMPKEPTESKVRKLAAALAYDELCNLPDEELNDDRILEFEEILIARKRA